MNPLTPPYTFRPMRHDDVPALHQLLHAIAAELPENFASTVEDVQRDFEDPWCDPALDTRLALSPDGAVVAHASFISNPEPDGEVRALMELDVHPAHQTDGLEEALLAWLEARGAERVRAIAAGHPARGPLVLRLLCWDTEHDRIARLQRHGFQPVRYSLRMRRDLRQLPPARPLPAGLVLHPYSPALDERLRQAHNEAFSDLWSHDNLSPSDWQQFVVQYSAFRPDLSFALLDGEQVAAYVINRFDPAAAARTGFRTGWTGSLGTRRPWRGQGLASALLIASMRAFQAAGLEYAGLGVDADNPSGAVKVYEHLGYKPYIRGITLQRTVEA